MTIELNDDQIAGLIEAVTSGLEDRQNYMHDGDPETDYGDEWPESARREAKQWRGCASVVQLLDCAGIAEMCEALADDLEASAAEYRNAEVGN